MRYSILPVLLFLIMFSKAQSVTSLDEVGGRDTVKSGQAIIYGNFIQRLGFSSGGFPQDIRLINLDTKEVFTMRVKATFKSAKENIFCYHIKPGNYAILNYWWTQSKWYGGKIFTEPIYKNVESLKISEKPKSGEIKEQDLKQFTFSISENTLNYLGTWHFDKEIVSFTDDKKQFDEKILNSYKLLAFFTARTILPD